MHCPVTKARSMTGDPNAVPTGKDQVSSSIIRYFGEVVKDVAHRSRT
jgi:hypothetical protein